MNGETKLPRYKIAVVVTEEDGGFTASVPSLGLVARASNLQDVQSEMMNLITGCLYFQTQQKEAIPEIEAMRNDDDITPIKFVVGVPT